MNFKRAKSLTAAIGAASALVSAGTAMAQPSTQDRDRQAQPRAAGPLQGGGPLQGASPLQGAGPLQGSGPLVGAGPLQGAAPVIAGGPAPAIAPVLFIPQNTY